MQPESDMLMPSVSRYMSRQPWTIPRDATVAQAHQVMRAHQIRHLPVVEERKLVGIVSLRDLYLMETFPDSRAEDIFIEEAMSDDVYCVSVDEPLDRVVEEMAKRKLGAAVVVDGHGGVDGIFTSVDALQVLAEVLQRATE
jgi:CBS domain-containing protein